MAEGRCKGCHAPISWCYTITGSLMPVDSVPDESGNVRRLEDSRVQVVPHSQLEYYRNRGELLFHCHFETCPKADRFRRGRWEALADGKRQLEQARPHLPVENAVTPPPKGKKGNRKTVRESGDSLFDTSTVHEFDD